MKKITLLCILVLMFTTFVFSQTDSATAVMRDSTATSAFYSTDLVQGLEAYKARNWTDALFFLRKTVSLKNTTSPEAWYLLIMAEMNLRDYNAVIRDGASFVKLFPNSFYVPYMIYQTILARFGLQMYNEVILKFVAFVEQYPEHNLVSFALFWTAESLYHSYEFERSLALYNLLVAEYPNSPKYADSMFRIELLMQREREEKLLALLRATGAKAVAAQENYERQIKQRQSKEALISQKKLQELEKQYVELQAQLRETRLQKVALEKRAAELLSLNDDLRISAEVIQQSALEETPFTETAVAETPFTETAFTETPSAETEQDLAMPEGTESTFSDNELLIRELREKAIQLQKILDDKQGGN